MSSATLSAAAYSIQAKLSVRTTYLISHLFSGLQENSGNFRIILTLEDTERTAGTVKSWIGFRPWENKSKIKKFGSVKICKTMFIKQIFCRKTLHLFFIVFLLKENFRLPFFNLRDSVWFGLSQATPIIMTLD